MAWAPEDRERIRNALDLPSNETVLAAIQAGMDELTKRNPLAIETVQNALTKWETLEATLDTITGDASYALVKADVLEWEAGARSAGPEQRKAYWAAKIQKTLNLSQWLHAVSATGYAVWAASYGDMGGGGWGAIERS